MEIQGIPSKNTCKWQVISNIIRNGANSRTEIASVLNVTGATLTKVTNSLIKEGILYETGMIDEKKIGRKQILIDVVPDYKYAIGIDISNTYLRVTLLDMKLQVRESHIWNYEELLQIVLDTGLDFIEENWIRSYGKDRILGIGLLAQGYIEDDLCKNLPIHNIKEQIALKFDIPIFMTNNIRGLAIAHSFLYKTSENFLLINYGPGVCSVIVENGSIFKGFYNKAGEIGHIIWNPKSKKKCKVCGKYGCLESLINFDEVAHQAAKEYCGKNTDYETLMTASKKDNGKALTKALEQLAIMLNIQISLFDPEILILSGQIFTNSHIYDLFLKLLREKGCNFSEEKIQLIKNYSEERLKSAGIVVFNEFF